MKLQHERFQASDRVNSYFVTTHTLIKNYIPLKVYNKEYENCAVKIKYTLHNNAQNNRAKKQPIKNKKVL